MALRQSPGTLFTAYPLRGNKIALSDYGMPQRTEFTSLEWNVDAPVLRHLPRILAVVSGDLTLVGTLPINLDAASLRTEDWEKLADQAPSGLVGPTQLHVPVDAPEEEKLMSDSFYAAHFNFRQDMRYLLQAMLALLSRKAWFPEPPATH
ncbi:MAG: sugar transferase [Methylococcales bacterium]|nr:sugar transferase [Methylococcales bacterium]